VKPATNRVAVIGGGINGAGIGWELVRRGYQVVLFERERFGGATSSVTSKLIHGGLRYLEHFEFGLVRESLRERAFLLQNLPDLVHPLEFVLPVYAGVSRPSWMVAIGLTFYDLLAGRGNIAPHQRITAAEVRARAPLRSEGLRGGFLYFDAQVDDAGLVRRVIGAAVRDGLEAREFAPVSALQRSGGQWIVTTTGAESFDSVVVAVGPWMNEFLTRNQLPTRSTLTLVRGSHLILDRLLSSSACLLQSPQDHRVFFVLPWKGQSMVGTTEVRHEGSLEKIEASPQEVEYLLERFNLYFETKISRADVVRTTAGVRPLIGDKNDLGRISRDYRIERDGTLIKVFGGKMTTFLSLARKVGKAVDHAHGRKSVSHPPVF
jgi:glycerol-3-phosphate dehydrogenase